MRINPDNKKIRYSGRIDWRNPKEPIWVYPCTSAEFKFTGKYLKIFLKNKNEYWQNYLGCILDGVQLCYYLDNKKENEIEIRVPENENGEHHVLFFKPINEQISNFAQTYPTNLKASSNEALLFMRRYRFANCSCFSCCFKDAYPSSNVQ